jgi:hypothetical protein
VNFLSEPGAVATGSYAQVRYQGEQQSELD